MAWAEGLGTAGRPSGSAAGKPGMGGAREPSGDGAGGPGTTGGWRAEGSLATGSRLGCRIRRDCAGSLRASRPASARLLMAAGMGAAWTARSNSFSARCLSPVSQASRPRSSSCTVAARSKRSTSLPGAPAWESGGVSGPSSGSELLDGQAGSGLHGGPAWFGLNRWPTRSWLRGESGRRRNHTVDLAPFSGSPESSFRARPVGRPDAGPRAPVGKGVRGRARGSCRRVFRPAEPWDRPATPAKDARLGRHRRQRQQSRPRGNRATRRSCGLLSSGISASMPWRGSHRCRPRRRVKSAGASAGAGSRHLAPLAARRPWRKCSPATGGACHLYPAPVKGGTPA